MFADNLDFYPTPGHVISKMLGKISKDARFFLEPSAGKGDIAARLVEWNPSGWGRSNTKVDCIESDPELVATLTGKDFRVVGHDFLTYPGVCFYDAIVMNPPFSEGARHLLRAWDFLHSGEIVCLLNAETIDNPCTAERERLASIIRDNGGEVEYLGDCFKRAERSTGVNVAMVYLKKSAADDLGELWETGKQERDHEAGIDAGEDAMLAIRDELGNMEQFYNEATAHMLQAFAHLRKAAVYMNANGVKADDTFEKCAGMALRNTNAARAEFYGQHRRAAWLRVFDRMEFRKWLDKKQTDEFLRDVQQNSNIPFTADNIRGTLENVILQRARLFEQSVLNVFDALTRYHKDNTNHTEGWKSNADYMVNPKLVFPWGCVFDGFLGFRLSYNRSEIDIYNDLDRILCILDGKPFEQCGTIEQTLHAQFRGEYRKTPGTCESEYFEIRYFKKGTIHLKWKRRDLWEEFNQRAAAGKKWVGRATDRPQGPAWPTKAKPRPEPKPEAKPRASRAATGSQAGLFADADLDARIAQLRASLDNARPEASNA